MIGVSCTVDSINGSISPTTCSKTAVLCKLLPKRLFILEMTLKRNLFRRWWPFWTSIHNHYFTSSKFNCKQPFIHHDTANTYHFFEAPTKIIYINTWPWNLVYYWQRFRWRGGDKSKTPPNKGQRPMYQSVRYSKSTVQGTL